VLRLDFTEACTGAAGEITARLGARFVGAAKELAGALVDEQGGAVFFDHPHVRAVALEPNELLGALTEARVIVTGDAYVGFEA
jgi:hypothetical protein